VLIMRLLVPLFAWSLLWLPLAGGAQIAAETAPAIPKTSPGLADSEPRWVDLSESQKSALTPLIEIWPALSQGHRRKWLALSQNYPQMSASEQEKLHARMVDWAALSTKDREAARLNFAQTKKFPAPARTANWEAYQALPEEDKKALIEAASLPPRGAAVAVKPIAPSKLAVVPVTRKTPEPEKAAASKAQTLDRYTLLPQVPKQKENLRLNSEGK
jgi:Protein of unknown function (DUF3106)